MRFLRMAVLIALPVLLKAAPVKDVFDLAVTRSGTLKNRPGNLHVDARGVTFQSRDGRTKIEIAFKDLREADVADPLRLRFETYDVRKWKPIERKTYTFRAGAGEPVEELAQFLATRILRPVVGHYPEPAEFRVPAYHRRTLNGTAGTLQIGAESIQYVSERPADSRTWVYRDIETIGRPDAFRFRVTTNRETYVLDLKDNLSEAAYQFAWIRVYGLEGNNNK